MLQKYVPFQSCLGSNKDNDDLIVNEYGARGSRWFFAVLAVVSEIAYIYDVFANSGSGSSGGNPEVINKLFNSLDVIKGKLDEINNNIDTLIGMMSKIPLIVRGEVEGALMRQALGEADAIVTLIQDSLRYEYIGTSINKLEGYCDNLQIKLGGIKGLRGLSGAIITAPYVGAWLSATVAVEKVKKQQDASYKINSPWTRGFMKEMDSLMSDFIAQAELQDLDYVTRVIPAIPPNGKSLQYKGGVFTAIVGTPLPPPSLPGIPPIPSEYRLTCPSTQDGSVERLQYKGGPGTPDTVSPGGATWTDVKPHTPPHDTWNRIKETREELQQFYDAVPKFHNMQSDILKVFVEPAGVW